VTIKPKQGAVQSIISSPGNYLLAKTTTYVISARTSWQDFPLHKPESGGEWPPVCFENDDRIRTTVFSWTLMRFPFRTSSAKKLTLNQTPVITVTGKSFFDVGHSLKDQRSNRRTDFQGYDAWEIYPVMELQIVQ
jgi:hypothetical protein